MKYHDKLEVYSTISKNVLAKNIPGTSNKISEEINVILPEAFMKQECNINLMLLCIF